MDRTMEQTPPLKIIGHIESDFPAKFGIPRQSGLIDELSARIVLEKEYRVPQAFRELENFSHIWLLWLFSQALRENWSPTVRPPRLGGNRRVGVFATRSPFRPNPIGLSAVKLLRLEQNDALGPVLYVAGADLMDGTPILDIKPYLPFTDARPEAAGGFAQAALSYRLKVAFPAQWLELVPADKRDALLAVLAGDPRPAYQEDPDRLYGFGFSGLEIKFTVAGDTLTVRRVENA